MVSTHWARFVTVSFPVLASLLRRLGRDEAGVAWHGRVESQQALDDFKMEIRVQSQKCPLLLFTSMSAHFSRISWRGTTSPLLPEVTVMVSHGWNKLEKVWHISMWNHLRQCQGLVHSTEGLATHLLWMIRNSEFFTNLASVIVETIDFTRSCITLEIVSSSCYNWLHYASCKCNCNYLLQLFTQALVGVSILV